MSINYNFECNCLIVLCYNKLPDHNLASELVENRNFFKPLLKELVISMIRANYVRADSVSPRMNAIA